jgi:hypothetical protein
MNNHEFVPGHNGCCEKCGDNDASHPGCVDVDALIDQQEALLVMQATEIERLRADAERYRWLRDRHRVLASMGCASGLGLDLRRVYVDTAEKLDAAIDAAIARQREPT